MLNQSQRVVGQNVKLVETYKPYRYDTWTGTRTHGKVGYIVEIGEGSKAGRVRVRWTHTFNHEGTLKEDGKRTWYNPDKLIPVEGVVAVS